MRRVMHAVSMSELTKLSRQFGLNLLHSNDIEDGLGHSGRPLCLHAGGAAVAPVDRKAWDARYSRRHVVYRIWLVKERVLRARDPPIKSRCHCVAHAAASDPTGSSTESRDTLFQRCQRASLDCRSDRPKPLAASGCHRPIETSRLTFDL